MSRILTGVMCVFALSACTFGAKTCDADSDCEPTGVCNRAARFCVAKDGGAAVGGGGGTVGGGGGTLGGGSGGSGGGVGGGGVMGGGAAGGGGQSCGPCNGVGQECVSDMCLDVALEIHVDVPDAAIGALPVDVPFRVTRSGGAPAGGVVMPSTVTVMPGVGANMLVTTNGQARPDGGFVFTARSMAINNSTPAPVDLNFMRAMGGNVTGSAMLPIDTRPSVARVELVEVKSIDAGARGMDWAFPTTVPVVQPYSVRRDDTVVVRVTSADAFVGAQLQQSNVSGSMTGPARSVTCPASAQCVSAGCACFEADMWELPMAVLNKNFALRFSADNERGIAFDGGIPGMGLIDGNGLPIVSVTRLRWKVGPSGGDALRAAPALDAQGTLYLGSMRNATAGNLYALKPDGKAPNATWASGINAGSVTSLSVSPQEGLVYFTANDSTRGGYLSAVTAAGGAPTLGGGAAPLCKGSSTSQRAFTAMALYMNGPRVAGVTALGANGANFGFCKWNPDLPDSFDPKEGNDLGPAAPDDSTGVSNLFMTLNGAQPEATYVAHFSGADAGVVVVRRILSSAAGAFTFDARVLAGTTPRDNGVVPASLADTGSTQRAAMSTNSQGGAVGLYKVDASGGSQANFPTSASSKAAVDANANQWVQAGNDLNWVNAMTNSPTGAFGTVTQFPVTIGAPMLGATSNAPDRVYAVALDGTLGVAAQVGVATPEGAWQERLPVGSMSAVSASPTLDCNRFASSLGARTRTGILYVVTNQGEVFSVVVDSAKLDSTAKWPKFQRDIFNSGNTNSLGFSDGCP